PTGCPLSLPDALPIFLPGLMLAPPVRVPGTAVFLTADPGLVPHALLHNLKHNKVLHEHNVFLTVETLPVPYAPAEQRIRVDAIRSEEHTSELQSRENL